MTGIRSAELKILVRLAMISFAVLSFAILHYALPSKDVVRIVGTEVLRQNVDGRTFFWANSSSLDSDNRIEVRFINAVDKRGQAVVFRNQDTGFGWPPYLKFDSADVQAEAQSLSDLRVDGSENAGNWVIVSSYGWRSRLWAIFPNLISLKPVDDANASEFSFVRISGFVIAALLMLSIWRLFEIMRRSLKVRFSRYLS